MHTEIMRSLAIRHAPLFDQPHSLKLELACKLPSLHHAPPVPSKHLTRCLRNRVQANRKVFQQRKYTTRSTVELLIFPVLMKTWTSSRKLLSDRRAKRLGRFLHKVRARGKRLLRQGARARETRLTDEIGFSRSHSRGLCFQNRPAHR